MTKPHPKPHDDDEEHDLTEEQEAELDESVAQLERGEFIDGDDAIRELKRRRSIA
jgi:hypothetical protein